MPGVDKKMFLRGIGGIDYHALQDCASALKGTLDKANHVVIKTTDAKGKEHRLELDIKLRQAHVCGGLAVPGEIINIPTGETYIAPNEQLSIGSVVLNGSTDHLIFARNDEVVLCFVNGLLDLSQSHFSDSPNASRLREGLLNEQSKNWQSMYLCEFGIGVNKSIDRLTGDEILDEKAAGTVHIALGANKPFGGEIDGTYHRDMIFIPDAVLCDGKPLDLARPPKNWKKVELLT
jgi:leucyl aminopeptidase (aminopeptidase T)